MRRRKRATRRALPSRTAPGPNGGPASIKELIRSDPSVLEEGFRILDVDLKSGETGTIDAIGVDRSGALAIVFLAAGDPEAALVRLLDARIWVADQRDLLERVYGGDGVEFARPIRGLLLAPSFSHAFLRRLALLTLDVTAYLAREMAFKDGRRVAIERAAPLFGIARNGVPGNGDGAGARSSNGRPFWPDEVLPPEEDQADAAAPAGGFEPLEDPVWPDSPDRPPTWERPDHPVEAAARHSAEAVAPPAMFETLTTEELEEFERFERQRRERDRRSP